MERYTIIRFGQESLEYDAFEYFDSIQKKKKKNFIEQTILDSLSVFGYMESLNFVFYIFFIVYFMNFPFYPKDVHHICIQYDLKYTMKCCLVAGLLMHLFGTHTCRTNLLTLLMRTLFIHNILLEIVAHNIKRKMVYWSHK